MGLVRAVTTVSRADAGLGSRLLSHVITLAESLPQITDVILHVQTNNDTALDFYHKAGFTIVSTHAGYYKKIEPPDAYLLSRPVAHSTV